MIQITLFDNGYLNQEVNVAKVPQRSPFRYPGGKTWLIPRIRQWLSPVNRERLGINPIQPRKFYEPFAGGASVSLAVAAEGLATHVTMVELDEDIVAVWQTILDGEGNEWLAQRILDFPLTLENVEALLAEPPENIQERAFQTIVKNRTFHGGILAPGSGLLKYGENGKGILSRWYPDTLATRIRAIAHYRHRITIEHGDGLEFMQRHANEPDTVFFVDPPYTVKGQGKRAGTRLYKHYDLDHERLFALSQNVRGDILLTYDNAPAVHQLADSHELTSIPIAMRNTHHAKMNELLIGRNLGWLLQPTQVVTVNLEE